MFLTYIGYFFEAIYLLVILLMVFQAIVGIIGPAESSDESEDQQR